MANFVIAGSACSRPAMVNYQQWGTQSSQVPEGLMLPGDMSLDLWR